MSADINDTRQTENFVIANGNKIYYESFGSGKSLIFLHGAMGTSQVWKPYVPTLSNDFNMILPDVRGHGKTENPGKKIDLHLMADDIAALIDALKLDKPFLCGWSTGGDIGLDIAMRYPNCVSRLIVGGVTLRVYRGKHRNLEGYGIGRARPNKL